MSEALVGIGMRAVVRDVQEWVTANTYKVLGTPFVDPDDLNAYLLALLITAGGYEDGDGEG